MGSFLAAFIRFGLNYRQTGSCTIFGKVMFGDNLGGAEEKLRAVDRAHLHGVALDMIARWIDAFLLYALQIAFPQCRPRARRRLKTRRAFNHPHFRQRRSESENQPPAYFAGVITILRNLTSPFSLPCR